MARSLAAREYRATLVLAVAASTILAWSNRFIQDDAFISFRYARNLSEGLGLTWNPGERVEGYTNFLWTLLVVPSFSLGIDPVSYSQVVGLALYPLSLFLAARLTLRATASRSAALVCVALLGTNYTFSAFATGGLETQLHVMLLLAVTVLTLRVAEDALPSRSGSIAISLLAAAAIMTRMDSVVPLAVIYGFLAVERYRVDRGQAGRLGPTLLLLVGPGALLVLAWLGWKLHYYGEILPNTYYAKLDPASASWYPGLRFIWAFVESYWLLPILALPLVSLPRGIRAWRRPLGLLVALVVAWCAYVVRVGGDFMEFRLLVPALPYAFALVSWLLVSVSPWPVLSGGVMVLVMAGSLHHARSFEFVHGIEPVRLLRAHVYDPPYEWAEVGRVLGRLFHDPDHPIRIATTAAGAIPFYSRLPAVDMLGLNDRWIARHGVSVDPALVSPGHNRSSPFAYLVERDVHLVVGTPWVSERKPGLRPRFGQYGLVRFGVPTPAEHEIPEDARMRVLEIDLGPDSRVYVLYLMGDEHVDAVIRSQEIRTHPVHIRRPPAAGRGGQVDPTAGTQLGLPSRPNIVLLTVDTLRADHTSAHRYDRATTPAMEKLSADGIRFANALSQAPGRCPPSPPFIRASIPRSTVPSTPPPG
jgi:hypothetical protein